MDKIISDIIKNISQIIKFDSSQSEAKNGAPFGEGVKKSLDYFLNLAEFLGFKTRNYDGYAGEVIFGEGKEFAILAHLDVVPAGNGWTHEAFGGEIDLVNRRVWGRGAMDDKGPAVIALFALKALKDQGFTPKRKIKLIVGCNEETGWECIKYYNAHAVMPEEGISPDAEFPVIYAEKGILQIKITFRADGDLSSLKGGELANMVCDRCEVNALDGSAPLLNGLYLQDGKIISEGKSAHGSTPDEGINAIPPILQYLGLDDVKKVLFDDCYNLKSLCDETGRLTFSPNVIQGFNGGLYALVDVRYPATMSKLSVINELEKAGAEFEIVHEQAPLYNDKNNYIIKELCGVYNEVTGKKAQPIAIGGGTYARALKFGAAFGPEEDGEECTVHQADEYISFEKIENCFKIYKLALERITGK